MYKLIINHCAPVLGGLKTGSLFNYKRDRKSVISKCAEMKSIFDKYGISIDIIKSADSYSLIYVYRKHRLEYDVNNAVARDILYKRGYRSLKAEALIEHLKTRIQGGGSFPHEVGLFLSYPPEDVRGFIINNGCNFKICSIWKVYCNEDAAVKKIAMYKHCTDVYVKLFNKGRALEDMIVAM